MADFSDATVGVTLPTRNEWKVTPESTNSGAASKLVIREIPNEIVGDSSNRDPLTASLPNFKIKAALKPYTDYCIVRVPHRGKSSTDTLVYRFLINPADVSIAKNTEDAQAFTRGGWQFGVWGEGFTEITMSGKSAGQYFGNGLTDHYRVYTESYRNLTQLQEIFNNNGYFFEGEGLQTDSSRFRIQKHQSIELWLGNIIWHGMFQNFTLSREAENPFLTSYTLTFSAWKERYRSSSPYIAATPTEIERGHGYGSYTPYVAKTDSAGASITDGVTTTFGPLEDIMNPGSSTVFA